MLPLICLLFFAGPERIISLQTNGMFLNDFKNESFAVGEGGDLFVATRYHLWHWSSDGKLINKLGGKGQGAGEFARLGTFYFDGDYYWLVDMWRHNSNVFDARGRFLFAEPVYVRQFIKAGDDLFTVDPQAIWGKKAPLMLEKTDYAVTGKHLELEKSLRFKKLTRRQHEFQQNLKRHWVVYRNNAYYVLDQLEAVLRVYTPQAIDEEAKYDDSTFFEPPQIRIETPGRIEPPERMANFNSRERMQQWWYSWSRFTYFGVLENDFVIAYEVPDPRNHMNCLQRVQRISIEGKALGDGIVVAGFMMGSHNDQIYIFSEDTEAEDPNSAYSVNTFRF